MKIIRTNTSTGAKKIVLFDEVIKSLENKNHNIVNRKRINYKLLNNEILMIGKFEFVKKIS